MIKQTMMQISIRIKRGLKWSFRNAENILLFLNPFILLISYQCTKNCIVLLLPAFIFLIAKLTSLLYKNAYPSNVIPIYRKRFTEFDRDGKATFHFSDITEMVAYLAEVENELEKRGCYRNEKKK